MCEPCRTALCVCCCCRGPCGDLAALAANHQNTFGLPLREVGYHSASDTQIVSLNSTLFFVYYCKYYLAQDLLGEDNESPK